MPHASYHCLTGETLSVGKFVTSPDPGMRANVSKNNASAVDYDIQVSGPNGPWNKWWNGYGQGNRLYASAAYAWGGMVWCPNYSAKGAIVVHGGGHGGAQGQFVYIYDLTTRLVSQLGAPGNLPANMEWAGFLDWTTNSSYSAAADLRDPAWLDYLYNGSYLILSDHSYNTASYITPAEGGGPKGSLLIPQAPKTQDPSQFASLWAPHMMSLDTGVISRAMTAPTGLTLADNNLTISVKDTTRRCIWYFRHSNYTVWKMDLNGGSAPYPFTSHALLNLDGSAVNVNTYFMAASAHAYEYVPEADAIVSIATQNFIQVFDLSTSGVPRLVPIPAQYVATGMPSTTFAHGGLGISMAWCPPQQAFYLYEGMGDTFCYVLRPSSLNFINCNWTWSKESFGGVAPANSRGTQGIATTLEGAYRRFFWSPSDNCFVWHDGPSTAGVCLDGVTRDGVTQMWRPPGTVIA